MASLSGKRETKSSQLFDILLYLCLLLVGIYFIGKSTENLGYYWQWYQIPPLLYSYGADSGFTPGPLLQGVMVTLQISAVSLLFALLLGLQTALMRLSSSTFARQFARIYLEVSRNTPLLIQIFFVYFVLGPILGLERFWSAVLALSLFEGAYASEIFRTGILAIEKEQYEAALGSGLSRWQCYRYIILPQAIAKIVPPLTNQIVSLVKDSALVSTIAIYDLTMQAQQLIAETYLSFEIWFTVALIYLSINATLSFIAFILKRHYGSY